MNSEHEIVAQVYAAKTDNRAADQFLRQYLPFIKSETAKFLRRFPSDSDDELSIAMLAFHESILGYQKLRGSFLKLAAASIRSRLIDYYRKEKRHSGQISLDAAACGEEDDRTLMDQLASGRDEAGEVDSQVSAKKELMEFAAQLESFGLSLADIADNCPKQDRTLAACHQALQYAKEHPSLLEEMVQTGRLPIGPLSQGSGISRKTLERHRKYMVAILLAYTNGFEIIRGHLRQISPSKGGHA